MTTRTSSMESARAFEATRGPLSEQHVRLYRALVAHGPMTAAELFASVGMDARTSTPLFSELCARGLVGETDARRCSVTGRCAVRWDVIAGLPRSPAPPRETSCPRCRRAW